jgi:hypothetical protein
VKDARLDSREARLKLPISHEPYWRFTANRILTVLKAILNKAFHDELVDDNVAWRRVKPFENVEQAKIRFLTEVECKRLINAARPDFRELLKSALYLPVHDAPN